MRDRIIVCVCVCVLCCVCVCVCVCVCCVCLYVCLYQLHYLPPLHTHTALHPGGSLDLRVEDDCDTVTFVIRAPVKYVHVSRKLQQLQHRQHNKHAVDTRGQSDRKKSNSAASSFSSVRLHPPSTATSFVQNKTHTHPPKLSQLRVGPKRNVMSVDDTPFNLKSTGRLLKHMGHSCVTAKSGLEGLAVFEKDGAALDMILMDLSMPGMDGKECASKIVGSFLSMCTSERVCKGVQVCISAIIYIYRTLHTHTRSASKSDGYRVPAYCWLQRDSQRPAQRGLSGVWYTLKHIHTLAIHTHRIHTHTYTHSYIYTLIHIHTHTYSHAHV
jgi:hypothetical protein